MLGEIFTTAQINTLSSKKNLLSIFDSVQKIVKKKNRKNVVVISSCFMLHALRVVHDNPYKYA
jgi:hypothetical protein